MEKPVVKKLFAKFVRWLTMRHYKPMFVFTRHVDGKQADVSCCACAKCRNYFWVQHAEIEEPKFCPYCGVRFTITTGISGEEMNEIQVL